MGQTSEGHAGTPPPTDGLAYAPAAGGPGPRTGSGLAHQVFPRHKACLEAFEPASDPLGIGTFENPVTNGSMAVFAPFDSAQRFVASDPFVVEGLVRPSEPLGWNA